MLSDAIRNAAEYNEFDLETWAHEARKLEDKVGELEASRASWVRTQYENRLQFVEAENAELSEEIKRLRELVDECDGWSGGLGA